MYVYIKDVSLSLSHVQRAFFAISASLFFTIVPLLLLLPVGLWNILLSFYALAAVAI